MGSYAGTLDGYTYYHSDDRNLQWEEDILYLAEIFLQKEPYLAEECFVYRGREGKARYGYESLQDMELRNTFLEEINVLIPQIPELSDEQILYALQKTVASLSDAHSMVILPDLQFPFALVPFYEEGEVVFRACTVPVTAREVLFGKLLAINDVPVKDIVERLLPYISCENEYSAMQMISNYYCSMLLLVDGLQVIGVIDQGVKEAEFCFETESGEEVTITAQVFNAGDPDMPDLIIRTLYHAAPLMYQHNDLSYWMQELEESQVLYVRFNEVKEREDLPYGQFFYNIMHTILEDSTIQKLIIDMRDNGGGSTYEGLDAFLQSLHNSGIPVYVLVDNITASSAVWMTANIMQIVENAVLVGTPTGEPPVLCGARETYTMPNSGHFFFVSTRYYDLWPGYEGNAIRPDITIYQTVEDVKNGVDTVLTQVLNGLDE